MGVPFGGRMAVAAFAGFLLRLPAGADVDGTGTPIFGHDFESGTFVGWSDKVPAACDDLILNGDETDVDCGGLSCPGCGPGETCAVDGDCADQAGWTNAFPSCEGSACTMGCMGENYDCDGATATACEVPDAPLGNHSPANAIHLGTFSCLDANTVQFQGKLPSDSRLHAFPGVGGFNVAVGAAPDYFQLHASGGTCVNDLEFVFTTSGGGPGSCYRFRIDTSAGTWSCTSSGSGNCFAGSGSGSYADGTDIFFRVEKMCAAGLTENVFYSVTGHI